MGVHVDGIEVFLLPKDDIAPHLSFSGYFQVALVFCALWTLFHCVEHVMLTLCIKLYRDQKGRDVHDYRMNLNSLIHAVTSVGLSVYCQFFAW